MWPAPALVTAVSRPPVGSQSGSFLQLKGVHWWQAGRMHILLTLTLDCSADAAWIGITSPAGLRSVSAPILNFRSLEDQGFAERWTPGEQPVAITALGFLPAGKQIIDISFDAGTGSRTGSRTVTDSGHGLSWPLTLVTSWNHQMTVSARADGRTDYRDRLDFEAGILTPAFWLGYWVFWQWRARGIRREARRWGGAA